MRAVIIIPTYNHLNDCLKPCIDSLMKHTHLNDEYGHRVVVVANGCADETESYLNEIAASHSWLYYIIRREQLGYTKAVNIGISRALEFKDCNRFVLLNNDTVILPHALDGWIETLNKGFDDPCVGITGPVVKTEEEAMLPFVIFFCAMIGRNVFEAIGLLDEAFGPGFGEDVDFCARAAAAGFKFAQAPAGTGEPAITDGMYVCDFPIYHAGTKTFGEYYGYDEIVKRNRRILIDKYGGRVRHL